MYLKWMLGTYYAGRDVECSVCKGRFRRFLPAGFELRPGAECPRCGAFERERLLWLFLERETDFLKRDTDMLEVGPRFYMQQLLQSFATIHYTSVDLFSPLAMCRMDIARLGFPTGQFDLGIAYSVLDRVPDDARAIREVFRVLKPGGMALLHVYEDQAREYTLERSSVLDPGERKRIFDSRSIVRVYGSDYPARLRDAGFDVRVRDYVDELGGESARRYGLTNVRHVFCCLKPG